MPSLSRPEPRAKPSEALLNRPFVARLDAAQPDFSADLEQLLAWDARESADVVRIAQEVIDAVRAEGDSALLRLTAQLDGVDAQRVDALELGPGDFARALAALPVAERAALETAAARIRSYHEQQPDGAFEMRDASGNTLGQRVLPLDRVGVYVPGGQAAYPSTVLMTAVPARVAGVGEVIAVVPMPNGVRNAHVLAAMGIAGVDRAFAIGGAQAVAALAYGTETVPRVDKIVGPGGKFVAAAKRLVFGPVGIDLIAGPSEVLVIADGSAAPRWAALDLFAQAEHDAEAQSILLSPDAAYLDAVEQQMHALLPTMPRADTIRESLAMRGALIRVRDLAQACEIANRVAPEHLQLAVRDPDALLDSIRHAGAIFLGADAAEVLGDYSAGPSHVLPTFGTARYASVLSVSDFQKRTSIIRCSASGVGALARVAADIADMEGLAAHAAAARVRIPGYDGNS